MKNNLILKSEGIRTYKSLSLKRFWFIIIGLCVLIILFIVNISLGSSDISLREILNVLLLNQGQGINRMIIMDVRLPMTIMTIIVGASLGIAGCQIQTILRNPIASPYTLGITNAATFGAALGLMLHRHLPYISESLTVAMYAFISSIIASLCVFSFASRKGSNENTIILFGVAINFLFGALTMMLEYVADDEDLKSLVFWSMGSVLKSTWGKVTLVTFILVCAIFVLRIFKWQLTAMSLDDNKARSLGVNTKYIRQIVILVSAALTSIAVCFVGTIGFIGIIAPHVSRHFVGEDQRFLMSLSAIVGALVMSIAFLSSKLLIPGVIIPIGLVTAIIGVPVFMLIIFKRT